MIPLPELAVELVLGLGAALFAANAWVLLKPRVDRLKGQKPVARPISKTRVWINLLIGAVMTVWAAATLITRR
jgi:quinol-cytochrome oxidoreductase complex cytochrome b subunit